MAQIRVTFEDGTELRVERRTRILDLLDKVDLKNRKFPVLAAHVDNKLVSLHYELVHDAHIKLIDLSHPDGRRVYERSLAFLMTYAAQKVIPDRKMHVLHSYNNGIYCEPEGTELSPYEIKRIEEKMREFVKADLPIQIETVDEESGVKIFASMGSRDDAVRLLKYMPEHQRIYIYRLNNFVDYSYLPLVHRTSVLDHFLVEPHPPGLVIILPERLDPTRLEPLRKSPKLFKTFEESSRWARILGVQDAGSLNRVIATGDVSDFVKIAEALHEKKIAWIADDITKEYERIKVVFIAGPSASGKTTFAKRLAIQLRVNEREPVALGLDNYFLDREKTPKDEHGNYDFDSINALDLELLNIQLEELLMGKEVEIPKFNFKLGRREKAGRPLKLKKGQILIVEGIHGLNPKVAELVPKERTYRIYVSALTQISIDSHNRISTSDTRLLRRLVRDRFFRGHTPLDTLKMWPNVRRGEEIYIFPYQENADAIFNSALVYELAVLKLYIEPMLEEIGPGVPQYADAVRLIGLLSHFLGMIPDEIPPTSILREFIGGSSFRY